MYDLQFSFITRQYVMTQRFPSQLYSKWIYSASEIQTLQKSMIKRIRLN